MIAASELSVDLLLAGEQNLAAYRAKHAAAWRPVRAEPIVEWIETKLRFGTGSGGVQLESKVGRFTFDDRPWWRFPLSCSVDPECRSLSFPAATQIGKTANMLLANILWTAEFAPAPGMLVVANETEAKRMRDRIYAIAEESAKFTTFKRIQVPTIAKRNLQEINLGSMIIYLAWAGSKSRTRSKPCWYIWATEVDVYRGSDAQAGDALEAAKQRTKDVYQYRHIFESSPSPEPSRIYAEERKADVRWRWYGTCPHCKLKQELKFFPPKTGPNAGHGGVVFTNVLTGGDGSELATPDVAKKFAYYRCLKGCEITNDEKTAFVENGNWYPLGWVKADGEPVRESSGRMGFNLWAIHSPNESFGSMAEEYLLAKIEGQDIEWICNRLALAHTSERRVPGWEVVGSRLAAEHLRGTVPAAAWFLTSGIDKQGENNGSRWIVRAWAPGKTSWLVDWGWIERHPEQDDRGILSDLIALEKAVLFRRFAVVDERGKPAVNPFGNKDLPVRLSCIDTNHTPNQIHRWMRSRLPPTMLDRYLGTQLLPGTLRAIRGDHTIRSGQRFRHNLVETNTRTGEKYEDGLHQWGLCVYPYYSELTDSISGHPGKEGSWYVTKDVIANGVDYLKQVTNFGFSIVLTTRGKKGQWNPIKPSIPVDYWDCEVYAAAGADMVVGTMGWDSHSWEQWLRAKEQRKQTGSVADRDEEVGWR